MLMKEYSSSVLPQFTSIRLVELGLELERARP